MKRHPSTRETALQSESSAPAAPDAAPAATATVLVVEDNDDSRTIYRTVLVHYGYAVVEALDGEQALNAAREHCPDLILLDLGIPLLDGWEVTRTLKDDPKTAHIPVLALTVHGQPEDRVSAREAGCDAYILKPAEPRDVVAEIARMLAGVPAPSVDVQWERAPREGDREAAADAAQA